MQQKECSILQLHSFQLVDKVLCSDLESHKRGIEINNGALPPNPYLPEIERKMWSFALCGVRLRALP